MNSCFTFFKEVFPQFEREQRKTRLNASAAAREPQVAKRYIWSEKVTKTTELTYNVKSKSHRIGPLRQSLLCTVQSTCLTKLTALTVNVAKAVKHQIRIHDYDPIKVELL